ncbi:MAG: hypothetical protein WBA28_09720 [Microbacteriaceae bacterium]
MSRSLIKIIGAFAVFLILFLGGFYGVLPLFNAAKDRDSEISNAQLTQQLIRQDIQSLKDEQSNLSEIRKQIAAFESSIPQDHEQEAFIRYLDQLAKKHEVIINEYDVQLPVMVVADDGVVGQATSENEQGGGLFESQIVIDVRAEYDVLIAFLSELQDSNRALRIASISVSDSSDRRFIVDGHIYQLMAPQVIDTPLPAPEAPPKP